MEKIKSNWKFVIYWFVVMTLMNVYIIPKYINHQAITTKRVIIGVAVGIVISLIMGLLVTPKTDK
jgi:ABC-type nitrate/sulfonate/bicarbonate transport system permease component